MLDIASRLNTALEGRYRIERELGEGGMATVYLADDLKHERKVALKVLKPELAAVVGAERFLAEIKTTANLQHPHILPLHDSGEADGFLFYVMPYIEGETLRDRLEREKQLPVDEAVRIAVEVADALDYAHRRGVIHRDVKPENVLLQDGRVLVADFGIALAVKAGGGARLTETGLSLGTPAYMSPEQATGDREVDGRSDIYAAGCLLYEMLSGEPPHQGSTAQAILANVLTQRPRPLRELRDATPAWLEVVTERALARLPADRFRDAAAMRAALKNPGEATWLPTPDSVPPPGIRRHRWLTSAVGVAASSLVGLLIGGLVLGERGSDAQATHVPVSLPPGVRIGINPTSNFGAGVSVSPDGRNIVFVGDQDGQRLYHLSLDNDRGIQPIPGTEGGQIPFHSSDGAWIGFVRGTRLMKIPAAGGVPTGLTPIIGFRGGVWSHDDALIYFVPTAFTGIWTVSADGGEATQITEPAYDGIDQSHMWPTLLPNGDLLFTSCCAEVRTFLLPGADPDSTPKPLLAGGGARYVPSGHLVFTQRENLMMATFDLGAREVGPPEPVLDGVITTSETFAELDVSTSGTVAYFVGRSDFARPMMRVWPDGARDSLPVPPVSSGFPLHFSPDGRRLLYSTYHTEASDLFIYDFEDGRNARLTTDRSLDYSPVWGPGPSHVTFVSQRDGQADLYSMNVNTRTEPRRLLADGRRKWPLSWTADGRWLLYAVTSDDGDGEDIWIYSSEADSAWAFLDEQYNEFPAAFAPGGDWLAYARDDASQGREVWAIAFPDGVPCPVSIGGGHYPTWSADGARLYYVKGDTLMVAQAPGDGSICDARPRIYTTGLERPWGLAPDESYIVTVSTPPVPELRLIIDWASELRGGGG